MSKKRSAIWLMPTDEFKKLVAESSSYADVLRHFKLRNEGNYVTLRERVKVEGLNISHFNKKDSALMAYIAKTTYPLESVMIKNSTYSRSRLKSRLLKTNLLEKKCQICGQEPFWNGKEMILILDHINGVSNDHRLENLRFVCGNCNLQLGTNGGKNIEKKEYLCKTCGAKILKSSLRCVTCYKAERKAGKTIKKMHKKKPCPSCGVAILKKSITCVACYKKKIKVNLYSTPIIKQKKMRPRKVVNRPSKEELEQLIKTAPMTKIGNMFGVTDNTIRKWQKAYNIEIKGYPRGYWAKVYANKIGPYPKG